MGDVASGETAGTIDAGSAQSISNQSQQAITDEEAQESPIRQSTTCNG